MKLHKTNCQFLTPLLARHLNSIGARDVTLGQRECNKNKKKSFGRWDLSLLWTRAIGHYSAASYFMESSSSTAIIAELETAKSACLEIMSPVVMSAEKLGNENNLLQDKISARSSAMPKQRISLCKNE